jgi:hypothetical protein
LTYRIVHWGTGNVGALALRTMMERPDFEIVGHFAFTPEKVGKDSAKLIGLPPSGLLTTNDIDALIALKADVLAWFGNAMFDALGSARTVARFLEAGTNVVATGLYELGSPGAVPPELREIIEPACRKGNATMYSTGYDPGFATTQLAVTMYGLAHRVDQVRLQEFADYGAYPDETTMRDYMGFGKPMDVPSALSDGAMQKRVWGPTVHDNARALGLSIEGHRFRLSAAPALEDRQTSIGLIEKGTVSVLRFELVGMVRGEEKIVVEHLNWMHAEDIPADWPAPPRYEGKIAPVGYRNVIKGEPNVAVEVQVPTTTDGLLGTALHATNAIPMVVAAPPGVLSQRDIKPYAPVPLK